MGDLRSFESKLQNEKMACRNFRQGLVLFNLRRQMALSQKNATFSTSTVVLGGDHPPSKYELHGGEKQKLPIGLEIGNREVVGYGNCGQENYVDHIHYPFPAIRFKEDTGEIAKLREKEKGEWKKVSGYVLIALGISLWMVIWTQKFAIPGGLRTLEPEYIKANIQKRIDMEMGPIEGVASQYDYEKNQWKK